MMQVTPFEFLSLIRGFVSCGTDLAGFQDVLRTEWDDEEECELRMLQKLRDR